MVKDPNSTVFQKAIACKKLAFVGGKEAVQPMAALLDHPQLACYARFGLEPNPDPSVDEALRAALPKLKGRLQVGVITSIGVRKDAKALDALTNLIDDSDAEVAGAAAASVGMIGGLPASKILQDALGRTKPPVFPVVARACSAVRRSADGGQPSAGARIVHPVERDYHAGAGAPGGVARAQCRGPRAAGCEGLSAANRRGSREQTKSGFLGRGR